MTKLSEREPKAYCGAYSREAAKKIVNLLNKDTENDDGKTSE